MKPSLTSARRARAENFKDGLQLAAESVTWLSAWVLLPIWLAFQGAGILAFLGYVLGAGSLLAFGVMADRNRAFDGLGHVAWFAGLTCVAIFLFGGLMFGVAHFLLRVLA